MAARAFAPAPLQRDALRWGGSALVAALLHAVIVCAFIWRNDEVDEDAGAPVVMMELAPVASAPPAPATDLPPGPDQEDSAEQQASSAAQKDRPKDEVQPDSPDSMAKPPEPKQTEVRRASEASSASEASAPASVEAPGDQPRGPPVGAESARPSPALVNWRNQMLGRLKRFHRYPAGAHDANGVVLVEFSMDREGRLLGRRLVKSSGNAMLDRNALELIERSAPFPEPPKGVPSAFLTIVVPVRYDALSR